MKSNKQSNEIQVSKIINTVLEPGIGFLGFVITYPDGKIENTVLDYQPDNFELIYGEMQQMYNGVLRQSRLTKAVGK